MLEFIWNGLVVGQFDDSIVIMVELYSTQLNVQNSVLKVIPRTMVFRVRGEVLQNDLLLHAYVNDNVPIGRTKVFDIEIYNPLKQVVGI
jgi:hypothetical protein